MSTKTTSRILVTGASGFLGFKIAYDLLEAGHSVVGSARGAKIPLLKNGFAKYPKFEAVDIPDISSGDLTEALKGVDAIIHTAAPIPGRAESPESALKSSVGGSIHVLTQAVKAGVKKIVITGSIVTFPSGGPYGVDDFQPITREDAFKGNIWLLYAVEKKLADEAILEFADAHPEIDVTILSPGYIFGPFAPGFEEMIPKPDPTLHSFSTNVFIYSLLRPDNIFYIPGEGVVDVRDVSRAHIAALSSTPSSVVGHKRYLVMSPHAASFSDAIKFISDERPELRNRLADSSKAPSFAIPQDKPMISKGLEDVVHFKHDSYKSWKETILDTVDSLVALENSWKAKGYDFDLKWAPPN